eukprot:maker-scaffold37_size504123-snap-gene-4.16 protein:Tk07378 transcript:maker-scaffold37_size504123-snap-gene-4.16-mRNA-1 annotation:"luciferin 4-monooxygenase"
MSLIKDKVLYSKMPEDNSIIPDIVKESLVEALFQKVQQNIETNGDFKFLINCNLGLRGLAEDEVGLDCRMGSEMEPMSRKTAKLLRSMGFEFQDVLHLALPNTTEYFFPVLGTFLCQGVVSLGDPDLKPELMRYQILESRAKFVVCHPGNLAQVRKATRDLMVKILVVRDCPEDPDNHVYSFCQQLAKVDDAQFVSDHLDIDQRMAIIWSSGTTGMPKGIQHSFRMIADIINRGYGPLNAQTIFQSTCFFHGGGFGFPISVLSGGQTACFFPTYALENTEQGLVGNSKLILDATHRYRPEGMMLGSHHAIRLSQINEVDPQLDLDSVRYICPMGTNIPEDTYERLHGVFPALKNVFNLYSLTEFGALITFSTTPRHLGSVAPGTTVKIVDSDTQETLGANQVGEIMAKGTRIMMGYLNRPKETEACLNSDGFLHTGDLGHYDEDGIMFFDGRLKELIKFENKHLYPMEIEEIIRKLPGVSEVAVFGKPDPISQELVTAVVVKSEGSNVNEKTILDLVTQHVDDYKRIRGGVIFVPSLPRNSIGKIMRRHVKTMYS